MKEKLFSVISLVAIMSTSYSQSPVDGFMQGKGKGNVVVSYSTEKYDKVFLVPNQVQGVPVFNDVENTSASLYFTYGISSKLDVVFSLPYVKSEGNASQEVLNNLNFENERSGLQDASVFVKYNPFSYKIGTSTLNFIGALGVKTPVGDYKFDEGLQSIIAIGNGSTVISPIGIVMLKLKSGLFTTGQLGYGFANNDVPNSVLSEIKIGYAASKFYADFYISAKTSQDGVDILGNGFTGYFPATKVSSTRLGLNLYAPIYKNIGLASGFNSYVEGRNLGKSTGYYGALIYKF